MPLPVLRALRSLRSLRVHSLHPLVSLSSLQRPRAQGAQSTERAHLRTHHPSVAGLVASIFPPTSTRLVILSLLSHPLIFSKAPSRPLISSNSPIHIQTYPFCSLLLLTVDMPAPHSTRRPRPRPLPLHHSNTISSEPSFNSDGPSHLLNDLAKGQRKARPRRRGRRAGSGTKGESRSFYATWSDGN